MESLGEYIRKNYKDNSFELEKNFDLLYNENPLFKKIVNSLDIEKSKLINNTSKIKDSCKQLENCMKCKNILECKNEVNGYVYYPTIENDDVVFSYIMCKHKRKLEEKNAYQKNITLFEMPKEAVNASMKDIDTEDKNRYETIIWLKNFLDDYKKGSAKKGLYLTGNFGCGKTYLICAMLNELAKRNKKIAIVYYPDFLRSLKESMYEDNYSNRFNEIKKAELLLIDDIGAETTTAWSRDEILGTILQYRMQEGLITFFTSNFNLDELEEHFSISKNGIERVKARRIMERIKQLTDCITMVSENRRKWGYYGK